MISQTPSATSPITRAGQLAPVDVALDHDRVAVAPFGRRDDLRRMRLILLDDDDAEARAFADRLDHIGRRHRMLVARSRSGSSPWIRRPERRPPWRSSWPAPCSWRAPRRARRNGCRECARYSRMPWMVPSSPNGPCSALKATSGFSSASTDADIAADIDAGDAVALGFERVGAGLSRRQRHRPLGRKSAHQHRDVLRHRLHPLAARTCSSS